MGISEFGEMHRLATMANPDICVITNIGLCHLENLKTSDGILKAKTESFAHLKKDGIAILNGDDDKLSTIRQVGDKEPVFYGMEEKMEYRAEREKVGIRDRGGKPRTVWHAGADTYTGGRAGCAHSDTRANTMYTMRSRQLQSDFPSGFPSIRSVPAS